MKAIPGEGMPKHRNPFDKGSLNITFTVDMPDEVDEKMMYAPMLALYIFLGVGVGGV